jgi:hypothetical protein
LDHPHPRYHDLLDSYWFFFHWSLQFQFIPLEIWRRPIMQVKTALKAGDPNKEKKPKKPKKPK